MRRFNDWGYYTIGILILLLASLYLVGCGAATKEIIKVDSAINKMMLESPLSLNCKAGIANGFIIAPDSNAAIRGTAAALLTVADKESPEYKKCFGQAVWISFLIHGSKDLGDKIIAEIAKIPANVVLTPTP